ncbi:MAG TPA: TIGR04552 family protein [Myxococcales bacterium LLY-WYZ-16_1]|nr:TIGR04552 family protein [Myxococcales bacterium LLY-WYZ-16_1]
MNDLPESLLDVPGLDSLGPHEVDVLRLLLNGGSVVDWIRLHFRDRRAIDDFLRVNELDPDDEMDQARIADVQARAIAYLTEHLRYRLSESVRQASIQELCELASGKGRRAHRLHACLVLKVIHIIHHVEAYELLSTMAISHHEVAILLQAKVERVVRRLIDRNAPVVDFAGNTKTYHSTLSKLLAKKDTHAAQVFDRLRFRLVVARPPDIPALLVALTRTLIPFPYLVPSQSENTLIDLDALLRQHHNRAVDEPDGLNENVASPKPTPRNEFSGPDYRVVNFVAQVPVRVDRVMPLQSRRHMGLGPVVFGTVEFQVVDRATALHNDSGANRHTLYKRRQTTRVRERLERGKRQRKASP